ncbi:MAG: hypothetical protein HC904_10795 [Blastochloris sp.]|nr:hypothetical protein [Blastochloris sp.]
MSRNRLKQANGIQAKRLWKLFVCCIVMTVLGLVYVFMQIQTIKLADANKKLESERDDYRKKNEGLELQITRLKQATVLQQKLSRFNISMVPLSELRVIPAQISPSPQRELRQLARADEIGPEGVR